VITKLFHFTPLDNNIGASILPTSKLTTGTDPEPVQSSLEGLF
jgi:hypothetical protein